MPSQVVDKLFGKANKEWERGRLRLAFRLFLAAAKEGDTGAQVNVGYFYDVGVGIRPNRRAALHWYTKAYKGGERTAASNIATVFRDQGNLNQALLWFRRAAKRGDGDANLELAKLYLRDLNDAHKAAIYLAKACRSKSTDITASSKKEAKELLQRIRKRK